MQTGAALSGNLNLVGVGLCGIIRVNGHTTLLTGLGNLVGNYDMVASLHIFYLVVLNKGLVAIVSHTNHEVKCTNGEISRANCLLHNEGDRGDVGHIGGYNGHRTLEGLDETVVKVYRNLHVCQCTGDGGLHQFLCLDGHSCGTGIIRYAKA